MLSLGLGKCQKYLDEVIKCVLHRKGVVVNKWVNWSTTRTKDTRMTASTPSPFVICVFTYKLIYFVTYIYNVHLPSRPLPLHTHNFYPRHVVGKVDEEGLGGETPYLVAGFRFAQRVWGTGLSSSLPLPLPIPSFRPTPTFCPPTPTLHKNRSSGVLAERVRVACS